MPKKCGDGHPIINIEGETPAQRRYDASLTAGSQFAMLIV
ncbi:hypothetical protein CDHC01_1774 [Corynebacterium diphtheriae HC01]|nr:hypothetical protein CD241_1771 [Corynebacterium diphtheriae 241]AEX75018.1 hypothetical protein CDHC01_1774 [Corynebacterium diphtheriae HC01]